MKTAELEQLLLRVEAGGLDELTEAQVSALAEHLDGDERATARLARAAVPADVFGVSATAVPSVRDWAKMEEQLVGAAPQTAQAAVSSVRRLRAWRWGSSIVAVAACAVAALMFNMISKPAQAERFDLAADTEIASLEVGENSSSMVVMTDGEQAMSVIVVMDTSADDAQEPIEVPSGDVPVVEMSMD